MVIRSDDHTLKLCARHDAERIRVSSSLVRVDEDTQIPVSTGRPSSSTVSCRMCSLFGSLPFHPPSLPSSLSLSCVDQVLLYINPLLCSQTRFILFSVSVYLSPGLPACLLFRLPVRVCVRGWRNF